MRVKLIFIVLNHDSTKQNLVEAYKKIIFPINLKEVLLISDLKSEINKFLNNKGVDSLNVENLFLEGFLLMNEFEVGLVLNNDDEIR
jgi:hypothetical protein